MSNILERCCPEEVIQIWKGTRSHCRMNRCRFRTRVDNCIGRWIYSRGDHPSSGSFGVTNEEFFASGQLEELPMSATIWALSPNREAEAA